MQVDKAQIISTLTGIGSYKKNYYVELQQKINEVTLRNKQLEIINQVAKSFNIDLPIEQIIKSLAENLLNVVPVDEIGLLILFEGECKKVKGLVSSETLETIQFAPDEICQRVIAEKKSSCLREEGGKQTVHVPLAVKNRVLGVLSINNRQQYAYSAQDVTFLEQLAEHLSVGLHNIRLFSEVVQREIEWEDTFRAITDAIVVIDTDYRIVQANEIARKVFAQPENPAAKCYQVIQQRTEPCDNCPRFIGDTQAKRTYQFAQGKNRRVYDVYAYPMFGRNGTFKGVFEVYKDVTQQISIEAQLVQSEKLAAIGKLAAGVAHELNSPLTAILGNSQLLLRQFPAGADSFRLMEDIKQCGVRCKTIIQNLLSFARQQQFELQTVSLNDVITRAIQLVGHQIRQERIELICRVSPVPEIKGNCQQLEQVIVNLLINAKDALGFREEGRRILVSSGCCSRHNGDYLFVAVEDNGCGMDSEQTSEIFTPFYTTKDVGKGTGLGLAVSMGIVQNHGGSIECQSTPGAGSTFLVLLPVI